MFSAVLCYLLSADTPRTPATPPSIPLEHGQEIGWKGTLKEVRIHPGVTAVRSYAVETSLFVLETHAGGADVAVITVLKLQPDKDAKGGVPPTAARLVLARVDRAGRLGQLPAGSLSDGPDERPKRRAVPFEPAAPDTLPLPELGMLPPLPEGWQTLETWEVPEPGRPSKHWKNQGPDTHRSARCTRLDSEQHGEKGDRAGASETWRSGERAWISPSHGYAVRYERTFERLGAGTGEVEYRVVLKCEQAGQLRYSNRAYEQRRDEIAAAAGFAEELEKMLPNAGRTGSAPFVRLLARIDHAAQNQRPLSEGLIYREALNATRRKAAAAVRGYVAPETAAWSEKATGAMVVDRPSVDFAGENANGTSRETWRLSRAKGKPVLLLYYQPHAASAATVLRAGQQLQQAFGSRIAVVGMAIGDMETARTQAVELQVELPILDAGQLRKLHGVQSTPTAAVIDAGGVVRSMAVGWGEDTLGTLRDELGKLSK